MKGEPLIAHCRAIRGDSDNQYSPRTVLACFSLRSLEVYRLSRAKYPTALPTCSSPQIFLSPNQLSFALLTGLVERRRAVQVLRRTKDQHRSFNFRTFRTVPLRMFPRVGKHSAFTTFEHLRCPRILKSDSLRVQAIVQHGRTL